MKNLHAKLWAAAIASLAASAVLAQQAAPADVWNHKTPRLDRAHVDRLLAKPGQLVVIDVRRPDELAAKGSFPAYLNIQAKDIENQLDYIPKERAILTVSNHAHRAGAVGDVLAGKGFKVAGATGSEDYEAEGGKITRVLPPPPKAPAAP